MGKKAKSVIPRNLKIGDYVLVYWVDIVGRHSGDKKKANLCPCVTGGFFDGYKTSLGKRCLITRDTYHPGWDDDEEHEGTDTYPMSVVLRVELIRKEVDITWPT